MSLISFTSRKPKGSDTSSSNKERTPKGKKPRTHRTPAIAIADDSDVITAICTEMSRRLLTNPDVRTGTLFETGRASRLPINMSDTVILVTASILEHLGNDKAAAACLCKSATVTKMYEKMGLNNELVRSMFVTAIFAMNPLFLTMAESCVRIAIERLSEEARPANEGSQMTNALEALTLDGTITKAESETTSSMRVTPYLRSRRNSIQKTPTNFIRPEDSASQTGANHSRITSEHDLHEYLRRKKARRARTFTDEFPESRPPLSIRSNTNRYGLGFVEQREEAEKHRSLMSEILDARDEGSNIPLTPSDLRKVSISSEEDYNFLIKSQQAAPSVASDLTIRKDPIPRTRIDPSVIAFEESAFDNITDQFRVNETSNVNASLWDDM